MTSQLKAKLLQHFAGKKNANGGFTLIELLVVIIIIGILSAIALPSFLNQANKAKQSEAKTYVGSLNRAQQAYYLEEDTFAADLATLGLGIDAATDSYNYVTGGTTESFSSATPATGAASSVKSYGGGVDIDAGTSVAVMCEALEAPINGGDAAVTIASVFGTSLDSATAGVPACVTTATTGYEPLN